MRYTNHLELPQPIATAVANDDYTRGDSDYSVTELIGPARQVALRRKFEGDLKEDVADNLWALYGKIIHGMFERADYTAIVEQRLYAEVDGVTVSGKSDRFVYNAKNHVLQDYKFTSAWTVRGDKPRQDWIEQLNIYAWLLRVNRRRVDEAEVWALLRDWSKLEAKRNADYPPHGVKCVKIPLWPNDTVEKFVRSRVATHEAAKLALPLCSDEERWKQPDKYAVMKKGRKSALFAQGESFEDAKAWAERKGHAVDGKTITIEHRPSKAVRCESYCNVAHLCQQYQAEIGGTVAEPDNKETGHAAA